MKRDHWVIGLRTFSLQWSRESNSSVAANSGCYGNSWLYRRVLFHEYQFSCLGVASRLKPVEIDSARQSRSVEGDRFVPGALVAVRECDHQSAKQIIDSQSDMTKSRDLVTDHSCRIERIGEVL